MALSDQLEDLAGRTKRLEDEAAALRAKNVARMEQQREQVHASMQTQAANVRTKAAQTKTAAQEWWTQTTNHIEEQRAALQAKREQRKAEQAVESAERQAEASEDYASMLASLAAYAVDAAADAALDAGIARAQADALKKEQAQARV